MMNKGTAIVSILIAFVGGVLIGNLTAKPSSGGDEIADAAGAGPEVAGAAAAIGDIERVRVPVSKEQPVKGPADAPVTIVQISDYQCPFCSRVEPTISSIMNTYKDKVRVVWRNNPLPFHPNAEPAAQATLEAFKQGGNEKFWALHNKIFTNQGELTPENLLKWAGELKLNVADVKKAMDTHAHKAQIDADQALAAKIGARGTPHFAINGRKLSGAQPLDAFKEVIDDELKRAADLVKKGVAKNAVYAEFMRNATDGPAPDKAADAPPARPQPDPNAVYKVPVTNEPVRGSNDALVTIVEVSDFECPFCGRVGPTIKALEDKYGKDLRVVWYDNPLPFHKDAPAAHQAAAEAFAQGGNAKFWALHDKMFANQQELSTESILKWAKEIGLNVPKVKAAIDGNTHQDTIDKHKALAAQFGATGTPSFFINGRNLRGAQPQPAFEAVIEHELAKAKALVAAGTPRSKVYEETIKNGKSSPQMLAAPAGAAPSAAPAEPDANKIYNIAVPKDAPVTGAKNGKVVIQIFSDFQCPFCSRVEPTLKQVLAEYGSKVTLVWRDYPLPFHNNAHPAAEAAREVFEQGGNEKFWKFHDLLFSNQQTIDRADLEKFAAQVGGINMAKFKSALDSGAHKARVDADMAAVTKAGAQIGTPSFFINGKLLQGAQPYPAFKAAIDAALN